MPDAPAVRRRGQADEGAPPSRRAQMRAVVVGSAGNFVEWYDWFIYSAFTLYFAKRFFPQGDQTTQLLKAAAVFAIGFLVRPVGAWLMGLYADRVGRRAALTWSVSLMCGGSFTIAALPDASMIGRLAPLGLLGARLIQGLSLGGEYGASAAYMSEMVRTRRRGFWSSFHIASVVLGQLAALGVLIALQRIMSVQSLERWGWRIPFALGGALALAVFWIRRSAPESGEVMIAGTTGTAPAATWTLLSRFPLQTFAVFAMSSGGAIGFYAYTTYMQTFLVNTARYSKETASAVVAASLVFFVLIQAPLGALSDRVGRKPLLVFAYAGGALATYALMGAIGRSTSAFAALVLICVLLAILSGYTAVSALFKAELYPAHIRGLGVSLPYALANAVFGGTAEYVALWFKQAGRETGFYIYVSSAMALALAVTLAAPDTARHSRIADF